jgi:hypothetical protein
VFCSTRDRSSPRQPSLLRTPASPAEVALVVPMRLVWIGMIVGSAVGGYLPALWGGDLSSFSSLILSGVGGILGIGLGNRFSE